MRYFPINKEAQFSYEKPIVKLRNFIIIFIVLCVGSLAVSIYYLRTCNLFNPKDAIVLVRSADNPEIYTHGVIFHFPGDPSTKHIVTVSSYPIDWSQVTGNIEVYFFADQSIVEGHIVNKMEASENLQTSGFSNTMFKLHEMFPAAAKSVELWSQDFSPLQNQKFSFYAYSPSSLAVKPYKTGIFIGISEQNDYLFVQADLPQYQAGLPAIIKKYRQLYLCGIVPGIKNENEISLTREGFLQILSYDYIRRLCSQ